MPDVPKVVLDRLRAQPLQGAHPDTDVLTAFAEQALSSTERERVLAHLAACGDCREVVALSLSAQEVVSKLAAGPAPARPAAVEPERRSWFAWPNLRWAAAAAAVVVVASALWLRPNKAPKESMVTRVNQEAETPTPPANAHPTDNIEGATVEPKASLPDRTLTASRSALRNKAQADQVPAPRGLQSQLAESGPAKKETVGTRVVGGMDVADKGSVFGDQERAAEERRTDAYAATGKLAQAPEVTAAAPAESDSKRDAFAETSRVQAEGAAMAPTAKTQPESHDRQPAMVQKAKPATKDDEDMARQLAKMRVEGRGNSSNYAVSANEFRSRASLTWRIADGSLESSMDSGENWQTVLRRDQPLLSQAAIGREVWAGGRAGLLLHSHDSGTTWTVLQPAAGKQVLSSDIVEIVITRPGAITLRTSADGTWATVDNGLTWVKK